MREINFGSCREIRLAQLNAQGDAAVDYWELAESGFRYIGPEPIAEPKKPRRRREKFVAPTPEYAVQLDMLKLANEAVFAAAKAKKRTKRHFGKLLRRPLAAKSGGGS